MIEISKNIRSWQSLKIVRSIRRLTFTKTKDSEYLEEIVLVNEGEEKILDFPLPINDYRHGIEIFDENGTVLSLKSRDKIIEELKAVDDEVRLQLQFQLENEYLLWIVLPITRPIEPSDTKTIRIRYFYIGDARFKKLSTFTFPTHLIQGKALKESSSC